MTAVYVVSAQDSLTKIGFAVNLESRLQNLRSSSPIPLRLAYTHELSCAYHATAVERTACQILDEYRSHGSWFRVNVEAAITAIQQAAIDPHRVKARKDMAKQGGILKIARETLGLSAEEMGAQIGISAHGVLSLESGWLHVNAQRKMRAALETAGVIFCRQNGGGPGVRLRDPLP